MATLRIALESEADVSSIEQVLRELKDLKTSVGDIKATLQQMSASFGTASNSAKDAGQSFNSAGSSANQAKQGFSGAGQAASQAGQAAENASKGYTRMGTEAQSAGNSSAQAASKVKELGAALAEARAKSQEASAEINKIEAELIKAKNAANQNEAEIKQLSSALNNAKATYKEAQAAVKELNAEYGRAKQAAKDASDGQDTVKSKLGQLITSLGSAKESFEKFSKGQLESAEGSKKSEGALSALNKIGPLAAKGIEIAAEALTELGKEALKTALDVDQSAKRIQAQLGATGQEAKKLSDEARGLFKGGFAENIGEATQQIIKVKQAFKDVGDAVEQQNIAEKASAIGKAFNTDFNDVIKTASTLSKNFGITATQALDLITAGFQKTGDLSGDLLDTLNEYAPQFARAGQSAQTFIGNLIQGSDAGAFNLDKIADAVKEFTIRIQDGSQTTKDGLAAIGINADELAQKIGSGAITAGQAQDLVIQKLSQVTDKQKQNVAGVALFGTQWEDVGPKVVLALQNGEAALGSFDGKAQEVSKNINSGLLFEVDKLKNISLDSFVKGLEDVGLSGDKAGSSLQKVGEVIGPLAEAIGFIAGGVLGTIAEGFHLIFEAGQILDGILKEIGNDLKPIGDALGFLGGLFGQTGQQAQQAAPGVSSWDNSVKQAGTSAVQAATGVADWGNQTQAASAQVQASGAGVSDWSTQVQTASTTVSTSLTSTGTAATTAATTVATSTAGIAPAVSSNLNSAASAADAAAKQLAQNITTPIVSAVDELGTKVEGIGNQIADAINAGTSEIVSAVGNVAKAIQDQSSQLLQAGQKLGEEVVSGFRESVAATDRTTAAVKELTTIVKDLLAKGGKEGGNAFGDGVAQGVRDSTGKAVTEAQKLADAVKKALAGAGNPFAAGGGAPGAVGRVDGGLQGDTGQFNGGNYGFGKGGPALGSPNAGGRNAFNFGLPNAGRPAANNNAAPSVTNLIIGGQAIAQVVEDANGKKLKQAIGSGVSFR
jgi:TP901 family phage tail tape measure protein